MSMADGNLKEKKNVLIAALGQFITFGVKVRNSGKNWACRLPVISGRCDCGEPTMNNVPNW
jgi:hypothetical protein